MALDHLLDKKNKDTQFLSELARLKRRSSIYPSRARGLVIPYMWSWFTPDFWAAPGGTFYYRRDAIDHVEWIMDMPWEKLYKRGHRIKKVKIVQKL